VEHGRLEQSLPSDVLADECPADFVFAANLDCGEGNASVDVDEV